MPKVSAEHMQARRDQIARAAVEQFSRRGIHSTSMANIIEASGLSAGAIYTHFASKDEVITYAARSVIEGVFAGIEGALETEPPPDPEQVITLIAEAMRGADVSPGLIVQVWAEAAINPTVRQTANEIYALAFGHLREYVAVWLATRHGLDAREARAQATARARVLLSLIYAHILQAAMIDTHTSAAFAAAVAGWSKPPHPAGRGLLREGLGQGL